MASGATITIVAKDANVAATLRGINDQLKATAKEAGGSMESLTGTLKEYASEQKQQARVGGFFARELAELAPLSDQAKGAIMGVVGALSGGIGLGFAIDMALMGVKAFSEALREHKEYLKTVREQTTLVANTEKELWKGVAETMQPLSEAQKAYNDSLKVADETANKLQEQFLQLQARGPGTVAWIKAAFGDESGLKDFNAKLADAQKRIDDVLKKGREAGQANKEAAQDKRNYEETNRLRLEGAKLQGEITAETERHRQALESIARDVNLTDATKRQANAQETADYQQHVQLLKAKAAASKEQLDYQMRLLGVSTEVARLEVEREHAVDVIAIQMRGATAEQRRALSEELTQTKALYDEKLRIARIHEQFATPPAEGTEDNGQNLSKSLDQLAAEDKHTKFVAQMNRDKQALREAQQAARQFGSAIGDALVNARTPGEALAGVMQAVTKAVFDAAIKSITATAPVAGANAAAAVAATPVVGPALAVAAMAAMEASVLGLIGHIGGRAAGGPVAAGVPYVVGERGPELIVPNASGTVIPNHQLGGGGIVLNANIHTLDPRGAKRELEKLIKELQRDGRI